jgi:hypothetical protein
LTAPLGVQSLFVEAVSNRDYEPPAGARVMKQATFRVRRGLIASFQHDDEWLLTTAIAISSTDLPRNSTLVSCPANID